MLINEVKDHLIKVIIPFWKSLRDDKHGGYYGYVDFDLNVDYLALKGCILNSRIMWFFSNAYSVLKDESLLLEANHAYEFFKNSCLDKEKGGVFWSLNYDGTVYDSTKHTYNQAFAIYALSSYYSASKNKEALNYARELFLLIEERCCDQKGYLEAFDVNFEPVSNEKLSENGVEATRTMNTLLHVFEAYTELYMITKDKKVEEGMYWILDLFIEKVYNPDKKRLEVFFDENWNSLIDLHSYGHDIEAAWLLDLGCGLLKDSTYLTKVESISKSLAKNVYKLAYNGHSLMNECENGIVDNSRIWWVQAEAVVGFLNEYEKDFTKTEYMQAVLNIWEYIKEHVIDKRKDSEWFMEVDKSGETNRKKPIVDPWKCPYHNGRMCFEIIRRNIDAS